MKGEKVAGDEKTDEFSEVKRFYDYIRFYVRFGHKEKSQIKFLEILLKSGFIRDTFQSISTCLLLTELRNFLILLKDFLLMNQNEQIQGSRIPQYKK